MKIGLLLTIGIVLGYMVKRTVNWLAIDNYVITSKNFFLEAVGAFMVTWSVANLEIQEAIIFSVIAMTLAGISVIDFHTLQIPLIFIFIGVFTSVAGILLKVIFLSAAFWGVFVGALIPAPLIKISILPKKNTISASFEKLTFPTWMRACSQKPPKNTHKMIKK